MGTPDDIQEQPRRSLPSRVWNGWVKPVAMAVLVVVTFRSAVADWNDVPSQSMEPTILVGDRIFVNKLAYDLKVPFTTMRLAKWSSPQRGDVVVFFSPANGQRMVKRVIGVPGDTILMRDNVLYINDKTVRYRAMDHTTFSLQDLADPEPYTLAIEHLGSTQHPVMVQPMRPAQRSFGPILVPNDHYFVMGDNRDNSGDSRRFGFVPRSQIMGKAIGLAFSLDHDNSYMPRWERFFRGVD